MQFMVLLRRVTERFSDDDFAARRHDESQRARALYLDGFIRQIWHRGDAGGACLLVEADSEDVARAQIGTLPMVAAGMLDVAALVPLKPYAGFGPWPVSPP